MEADFNDAEEAGAYRNSALLRAEYDILQRSTAAKLRNEKKSRKQTGGGQEESVHLSQVDEQISGLLGNRLRGDSTKYDSDRRE